MQTSRIAALTRGVRTAAVRGSPSKRYISSAAAIASSSQLYATTNSRPSSAFRSTTLAKQQPHHNASSSSSEPLSKTPLYDLHLVHGGKMVPFGGFHMPVQYSGLSVSQSHIFTREHASLFDVSHMVQRIFSGPGSAKFLQRVTPSDCENLAPFKSTLSTLMTTDGKGGISDDTIVARLPEENTFYVVTNAGCREKDNAYLDQEISKWNSENAELQVKEERWDGRGLIALQGPQAAEVLEEVLSQDLKSVLFGESFRAKFPGTNSELLISRGGYTGEDGFEISIPAGDTVKVTEKLLSFGPEKVQLAGLGARDSLRLEAGMCLYGHDLNDSITPVEAGLSWIIPKERRTADAGYYGSDVIAKQLVPKSKGGSGVERRRVGLIVEGAPAREGAEIVTRAEEGKETVKLGVVTSGCPSPSLGKNIAMGYVKDGFHKAGTEVDVLVRGRPRKAVVAKMPFVPTKYWKGTAPA
ncbi:putative aminomethyltransferase [Podospora fimiseda]|uniref:Aminomethyltransferase n=1 Tax=Podospora fimiseda TaxID=252190 RepID=A0AAN7BP83_9PEZI|nr:putative aminomethyltransferase [Podospora fimiseda]